MKLVLLVLGVLGLLAHSVTFSATPLGLPPVPIPADNPQRPEKIKLGDKLLHDTRFSTTAF